MEDVQQIKDKLNIPNLDNVVTDIKLPLGENGVSIKWSSNKKSIVSDDGKVTRPEAKSGDITVTLTANVSKGDAHESKDFLVTIKAKELTDNEIVDSAFNELTIKENLDCVVDNLNLPFSNSENNANITWSSDKEKVISNNGEVIRGEKDEIVTLTATIKKGSISKVKKFTLTVKAKEKDVEQELKLISESLQIKDKDNVDKDIDLQDSIGEAKVSWISNKPSVVTNDGKVTRPGIGKPDEKVKLTANVSKDGKNIAKEIDIIVKAEKELVATNRQEFNDIIRKSISDCKPSVDVAIPNYQSNKSEYDLSDYEDVVTSIGEMDFGKPSVVTGGKCYSDKCILTITFQYRKDASEIKRQKDVAIAEAKKIVKSEIKSDMTDFQKELALHDYLVRTADYDTENYNNNSTTLEDHTAYGVLVDHIGVCESYAKAMNLLLKEAGIDCKYVTGKSVHNGKEGGGHAWNMVKLDGDWYNLDATWDDPVSDRNGTASFKNDVSSKATVNHTYFNIPDDIFNKDHKRGKFEESFPKCTATKYSYYNMDVDEYTTSGELIKKVETKEQLDEQILKALKDKKEYISLRIRGFKMSQSELQNELEKVATKNKIWFKGWSTSSPDQYHVNYKINWK